MTLEAHVSFFMVVIVNYIIAKVFFKHVLLLICFPKKLLVKVHGIFH